MELTMFSRLFKVGLRDGEKGMALILAIGFLALLSILGAVVMQVSTRGLQGTASYMPESRAFYVSDRAVEYSLNRDIIVSLSPGDNLDLMVDDAVSPGTLTHKSIIEANAIGQLVSGTVADLGPNDLPPAAAELYGSDFGANMYHVQVESTAPSGGGTTVTSHVNASIVRLFKMDDDTIFRTSGGG
jgi:hypothetical protein